MSCSKIDPALHQAKKPSWIKVRLPSNPVFFSTKALISDLRLHTVCEEAQCPNRWECWSAGTATFMIAGERCTRACGFCAVTTAKPFALEGDEPERVAQAVTRMKLKHVVVTAVARDDLRDGGAAHFARTIEAIRVASKKTNQESRNAGNEREVGGGGSQAVRDSPEIVIEVLTPDFHAKDECLRMIAEARPHIFNHNVETVERLTPLVRSRAKYRVSLAVLRRMKELAPEIVTKSGIMLGLGETEPEIFQTMDDLRDAGVTVLTMGQYLRPTPQHLPVVAYVHPDTFALYKEIAEKKGFEHVASGPLVRSSYHAADFHPVKVNAADRSGE
jgi:lipoic acid synthetase